MLSSVELSNGLSMPAIGFGTWKLKEGELAFGAVTEALKVGYRHIDTAQLYRNEASVGSAINQSEIERGEIFVTTKVWNDVRGYQETLESVQGSLDRMGLDYVDLLLIHWPNPASLRELGPDAWKEANAKTWQAFEELYHQGKVKAIGVSNFREHHLEALGERANIMPMVNQIRVAPGDYPSDLIQYCKDRHIIVEAYSPFGSGELFQNDAIQALTQKYETDPASLVLSWLVQEGIVPLPRSGNPVNIKANLLTRVIDIDKEDRDLLAKLPGMSSGWDPDTAEF